MWLLSEYLATSLYSLKVSLATSSGGKTLLLPTPYALKMGLLDVAYRTAGVEGAGDWWPAIRDLRVAYRPPRYAVVSNVFTRILKPNRNPSAPGTRDAGPLGRTIGYREYVHYSEPFGLAVAPADGAELPAWLSNLLAGLSYLGKRGGFVQLAGVPCVAAELPPGYVALNPTGGQAEFDRRGLLQVDRQTERILLDGDSPPVS
jgi:hypothetical protein